jgi:O-antigen/teichoic acid export membrane protein
MTRHEGSVAAIFGAFAALDVLGALVLIPVWGILGAAASTALSLALMSATMAILARRRLGIQATLLALNTPARETRNA